MKIPLKWIRNPLRPVSIALTGLAIGLFISGQKTDSAEFILLLAIWVDGRSGIYND
jgi:hypothetical protein